MTGDSYVYHYVIRFYEPRPQEFNIVHFPCN